MRLIVWQGSVVEAYCVAGFDGVREGCVRERDRG